LIVGVVFIVVGATLEMPYLTSIGGALFGTSLGIFVGRLANQDLAEANRRANEVLVQSNQDLVKRLSKLVRESVRDSFVSDEEKISDSRVEWHLYYVTEMSGNAVWTHAILDFTKSQTPGRLTSTTYLLDESEKGQRYDVEAGRRDNRFIIFLRPPPISEESAATYVFPYGGFRARSPHYGVSFLETWDQTRAISPAILSRNVLHDHEDKQPDESFGKLRPEIAQSLDRQWQNEMRRPGYSFFPRTKSASLG